MSDSEPVGSFESVAAIGMRGRFPGARDVDRLWRNLRGGVESISTFSPEELAVAGVDPAVASIPGFVNAGAILDDVDLFDAQFFGFSARDAEVMDPQQRLFLECAWEAMEVAGYDAERYPGPVAIFAGSDMSTYIYNVYNNAAQLPYVDGMQIAVGNDKDHLTTHASYKLNLRGPSVCVQTACSTSLVAVCLACRSLLTHESDLALAGGVAVNLPQRKGYFYQLGGIVSPDGHCRPFDASAQGTVIGSGIGLVVLKRLSDALADGDYIHAVIKGSAINNDGSAKVGYHAPSVEGQARCIQMAHALADVDPETIGYVEAHGTATPLGDPIEVVALTQAFRARTQRNQYCAIGSVKGNFGHLASAAGVIGLIKAVLAVEHGEIPPSLHYEKPTPQIDFAKTPFFVNDRLREWPIPGHPRRAGVSSFGIGGTNAHIVLEEAPPRAESSPSRPYQILPISARTEAALEAATDNLASYLEANPGVNLADVAFVYQTGRKAFSHRRTVIVRSDDLPGAVQLLRRRDPEWVPTATPASWNRPVLFMFPGQGSQYPGLARGIYESEPTFRAVVDRCCDSLRPLLRRDLREVLFPTPDQHDVMRKALDQTALTQPALFVVEYALAKLWDEWGVVPGAMIGHSIGEWVAACLAGVFTLDDALRLVIGRARLMNSMPTGSMLAVPLAVADLRPYLDDGVGLAAANSPALSVLSGPTAAIGGLQGRLAEAGIPSRVLHTSHAFHSSMMEPILDPFVEAVRSVELKPPTIPILSNVTGSWMTPAQATSPEYWGRQLRETVRFGDGVASATAAADWIFLEVGPGQTLGTLVRQQQGAADRVILPSLPGPTDRQPDVGVLLDAVARLWLAGTSLDWRRLHRHEIRRRLPLPTYPFERRCYWIGPSERPIEELRRDGVAPPPPREVADWLYVPTWREVAASPGVGSSPSNWLIFEDEVGLGALMAERLEDGRNTVVRVRAGSAYDAEGPGRFTIRPGEASDYTSLLRALGEDRRAPDKVVHLWGVTPTSDDSREGFGRAQEAGFFSMVYLAQALQKAGILGAVQVASIANRLHAVLGDESLEPPKATLPGICKAIPQEQPNIRCRSIDVQLEGKDDLDDPGLIEWLIGEMESEPFRPVTAYRRGRLWAQDFEPLRLGKPADPAPRLRQGGVYLITGGLGNIGLTLAGAIAEAAKAKLVLVSRSPVPPRDQWEANAAKPGLDGAASKLRRLLELERLGAEVLVVQADVADRASMRRALAEARERFGPLNAVIHGAGNVSTDFTPIGEITPATGEAHFRSKSIGTYVLADLIEEDPLDFVMLLSSLSAILGGLGLATYGSANAFLDAFAAARNRPGRTPWISVNWDAWKFAEPIASSSPTNFILPADGAEAFFRILERAPQQIVVSTSPLKARIEQWVELKSVHRGEPDRPAAGLHARPAISSQYVPPRDETERAIVEVWEQLLGITPIGVHDKFFEMGGHSLLAVQVVARLRESHGIEIPVQRLFEAPTVAELSSSILDRPIQADGPDSDEQLSDILNLIDRLSDEEVMAMLENKGY